MQPYLDFMVAEMQGHDAAAQLKIISELSLEKRYIWRVASALKWGFADFDDETVKIDRGTLKPQDLAKVEELLRLRPVQFCLFLKALFGGEKMEGIMAGAVRWRDWHSNHECGQKQRATEKTTHSPGSVDAATKTTSSRRTLPGSLWWQDQNLTFHAGGVRYEQFHCAL